MLELHWIVWLLLAALAYGLVTAVLRAVAGEVRFQLALHDRLAAAQRRKA